jgi:homoserine kinase type II
MFALRRWPLVELSRLRFIHALQEFASMQVDFVPQLQRTSEGDTIAALEGRYWELATWLPGVADFCRDPTDARLVAAMQALARLHIGWEHFPTRMTGVAVSPAMQSRREQLADYRKLVPELRRLTSTWAELERPGARILDHFEQRADAIDYQLREASHWPVALQPCLRDIWHDHVLFTGDAVTGVVDFGAARVESVAGDIARLTGSLIHGDASQWEAAIAAYERVRPLSEVERKLIPVFDQSSVAMSGMQWLEWLLIDQRQFEMRRVIARLDEILLRIPPTLSQPEA